MRRLFLLLLLMLIFTIGCTMELAEPSPSPDSGAELTRFHRIYSYQWLPDNSGIAVAADTAEAQYQPTLWLVSMDGAVRHLSEELCETLAVSTDGIHIAFACNSADRQLKLFDREQGSLRELAAIGVVIAGFSPDGRYLAYYRVYNGIDVHSDGELDLWVYDLDSDSASAVFIPTDEAGRTKKYLGFSQDSTKLYLWTTFENYNWGLNFRYDLWEYHISLDQATRLSSGGPVHNARPGNMHPTEEKHVFYTWEIRDDGQNMFLFPQNLYVAEMDPYQQTRLTTAGGNSHPSFSPDGESIAYFHYATGLRQSIEVYVVNSDGSTPRQLTSTGKPKLQLQWSPDGSMLSFVQADGEISVGFNEADGDGHVLYAMNADGTKLRPATR